MTKILTSETVWLRPGQIIVTEGEINRDLFVLISGELKVEVNGKRLATIIEHGEVVGEMGALSGKPRTATVSARTAAEVLHVKDVSVHALQQLPSIYEKINQSVIRRYDIAFNKTLMYVSITGSLRRGVLQDAMRTSMESRAKRPAGRADEGGDNRGLQRHQVRQRIDERLAMHSDVDDPKILERIAMEYGVWDNYRDRIAAVPWLDESLVKRLYDIQNNWKLVVKDKSPDAVIRKAESAIALSNLLADYERMPGIRREMDMVRMEGIVPLKTKIEALKTVYFAKLANDSGNERERIAKERTIKVAVDGVKADSGSDVVMISKAARELGVETEYEEYVRNMVGMTETATYFVELEEAKRDSPAGFGPGTTQP